MQSFLQFNVGQYVCPSVAESFNCYFRPVIIVIIMIPLIVRYNEESILNTRIFIGEILTSIYLVDYDFTFVN